MVLIYRATSVKSRLLSTVMYPLSPTTAGGISNDWRISVKTSRVKAGTKVGLRIYKQEGHDGPVTLT